MKLNKLLLVILTLFILPMNYCLGQEAKMKAGVVEFELRNDIGLENGGKIIAELLSEAMVNVGKYEMTERVLLTKILEEQKLALSGVIDGKTAPEVGKIYGIQGLVTGSAMKVGDSISINARMINTQSGDVIHAGTIKFKDIGQLEKEIETLGYLVSGLSRDKMLDIKDAAERKKSRYSVGLGAGSGWDTEFDASGFVPAVVDVFYRGKSIDVSFGGAPPFGDFGLIAGGIDMRAGRFVTIGVRGLHISGNPNEKQPNKKTLNNGEYNTLLAGFTFRPTDNLGVAVYFGPLMSGEIALYDETGKEITYEIKNYMKFPPAAVILTLDWNFSRDWGAKLSWYNAYGEGDRTDQTVSPSTQSLELNVLTIGATYRFSLAD